MKKIIIAVIACIGLTGCGNKGAAFVGVWKNGDEPAETLTVSKVDGGYRVVSDYVNPYWGGKPLDEKLTAESDSALTTANGQRRALELGNPGEITSYLYKQPKTFTKAN